MRFLFFLKPGRASLRIFRVAPVFTKSRNSKDRVDRQIRVMMDPLLTTSFHIGSQLWIINNQRPILRLSHVVNKDAGVCALRNAVWRK